MLGSARAEQVSQRIAKHFWETDNPPLMFPPGPSLENTVHELLTSELRNILAAPFLPKSKIKTDQIFSAQEIVTAALEIPFQTDRLYSAGIRKCSDLTWETFSKIRPISKTEMVLHSRSNDQNSCGWPGRLYPTRSSGSSGLTLDIVVDERAIAIDTAHGYRQFFLQSSGTVSLKEEVANIYTVPWPIDEVRGQYVNHFISSLVDPKKCVEILDLLESRVLSLYPSNLDDLVRRGGLTSSIVEKLLVVVHSEQSSRSQRNEWSEALGCPVLDEYSSEESARIALELPCGHYHTCDDAVIVEILDPDTLEPQRKGEIGIVVVTNLLNKAMPFIRYIQGDLAIASEVDCTCQWNTIEAIHGRENDSFINLRGDYIPSGSILDSTYRSMFENGVSFDFELIQLSPNRARLLHGLIEGDVAPSIYATLKATLSDALGHGVSLEFGPLPNSTSSGRRPKRRPIRRNFQKSS